MSDSGTSNGTGRPPRAGVAIAAAALAVLMLGGGVLVAVSATDDDPWGSYAEGWTELPVSPPGVWATAYAWTGSEVVAWDGGMHRSPSSANTAYTLDPASKTWTPTATAPATGSVRASIWTGSEVLYFVGDAGHGGFEVVGFDPQRNVWDSFDRSPARFVPSSSTWTGVDVIVLGWRTGGERGSDDAWSFNPSSDAWSPLPSPPVAISAPVAAWSGHELIVAGWSGDLLHPTTDALQTLSFDPATSTWQTLPDSGLASTETGAVAVDGRPILWQPTAGASLEWQPADDAWKPVAVAGVANVTCPPDTAAIPGMGFSWDCGHPAVFSATTSTWAAVDPPMTMDTSIVPYGVTVAAEDGFLVNAIVPTPEGAPVREHTTYLWFWKPPAQ